MIDMLDLKHGQKVFELGAGSGWNAALMSKLVGPEGKIVSLEIISELADRARETLKRNNITNVSILNQDGGPGYADEAPYDRAIFTAGSPDLPRAFFNQIKENGILLYIFKNQSGSDQLFLLHKKEDHFESSETFLCSFVPVTGKYAQKPNQVLTQNDLMARFNIANTIVHDHPFSWSSFAKISSVLEMDFLKFCFSISAQNYYMVEHDDGEISCAYVDPVSRSMALIKDESIVSYGNIEAVTKFMQELQKWMYAGKPSSHHLQLRVYPSGTKIRENEAQWIVRHEDSVFVWDASERISSALWPEQLN